MPLKQKRGHQSRQKKRSETIENIWLEREVQNLEEPIMLRQSYLWHPMFDHAQFWIYCSSHTPLLTYWRDLTTHNSFDRNHHRKLPGKNKRKYICRAVLVADRFLSLPPLDHVFIWIYGATRCCLHSGQWRQETHTLAGKVSFMLNSSSSIFRLARFYSDLERSNSWIIPILRYMVHNVKLYMFTIGFDDTI